MKMKVMEVPSYPELEIVAKTVEATTGTADRKAVGRVLLTTEAIDKKYEVVDGDGTVVRHVDEIGKDSETELFVSLAGDVKSLASFKFYGGYRAENAENEGVSELYTEECDKISRLAACAHRMCEDHPECDNQWKIVDKDGKRWFIRSIVKSLRSNGKID